MKNLVSATLLFVLLLSGQSIAETRIALIIGNGNYQSIGQLQNPPADARLMAETLETVGFDVMLLQDAGQDAMKRGIAEFGRSLRRAGPSAVGLFYFAGHGVQSDGRNYLIPTGADIRDEADLDVFSIEADWVLTQMASNVGGTSIVILDACRNNPFETSFRSAGRGLARMGAPNGSFVAYATAPGDVAYDGQGRNSPYTEALSRAILDPGKPIEQVFKSVRIDVLSDTGGAQTPWDSSSLTRDFLFTPAAPALPVVTAPSGPSDDERALWERVRSSGDSEQIGLYLSLYPDGAYSGEAGRLLSELESAAASAREEAAAREKLESESKIAAVAPTTPVQSGETADDGSIRVRLAFDEANAGGGCGAIDAQRPFSLPLTGEPVKVSATAGHEFIVSAVRSGQGADVRIEVPTALNNSAPFEFRIDSTSVGTSHVEYSNAGIRCRRATVYLDVIE